MFRGEGPGNWPFPGEPPRGKPRRRGRTVREVLADLRAEEERIRRLEAAAAKPKLAPAEPDVAQIVQSQQITRLYATLEQIQMRRAQEIIEARLRLQDYQLRMRLLLLSL